MIYFLYKITHLPSGKVEWLGSAAGCWYRMEDGSLLKVHSLPAWCERCGRVANGESLGSIQEVEKQLEELKDPDGRAKLGPMFARAEADVVGDLEREWERRLEWRRGRKSLAKCLECGGIVVVLPWDRAVSHPGGSGEILVHME